MALAAWRSEADTRRIDPRYQGANYDANVKAARIVFEVAASKGVKPSQIALSWILHKGHDIVPIPIEMQKLDAALAVGSISGNRYADWVMATIDR